MNKIKVGSTFTVNGTLFKIKSIIKKGVHYEVSLYKSLDHLHMKDKWVELNIYYSENQADYVVSWLTYEWGFTGELIALINEIINFLKATEHATFNKPDGLEGTNI